MRFHRNSQTIRRLARGIAAIAILAHPLVATGCGQPSVANRNPPAIAAKPGTSTRARPTASAPRQPIIPLSPRPGTAARAGDAWNATRPLAELDIPLGSPSSGEWRAIHNEDNQSFTDYVRDGNRASVFPGQSVLIVPVGTLSPDQRRALMAAADFLSRYYGVPAPIGRTVHADEIPASLWRTHKGVRQLNVERFLDGILARRVGGNVTAAVAVTAEDLWPGEAWSFDSTFGWASFYGRTAAVSMRRSLGSGPADSPENILRLCKLLAHETGHAFAMRHCARSLCLMNGRASREENDRKPVWLCAECLAKASVATGMSPGKHVRGLSLYFTDRGLSREAGHYRKAAKIVSAP